MSPYSEASVSASYVVCVEHEPNALCVGLIKVLICRARVL